MNAHVCLAAIDAMLTEKGVFSYRQDGVRFLDLTDNLKINVERLDGNIARVYVVDAQHAQQPIPSNVAMRNAAGAKVARLDDNFFVSWVDSYTLTVNGQPHMTLNNQKEQAISGPYHAASGVMGL